MNRMHRGGPAGEEKSPIRGSLRILAFGGEARVAPTLEMA